VDILMHILIFIIRMNRVDDARDVNEYPLHDYRDGRTA